jgi:hypothetical protein
MPYIGTNKFFIHTLSDIDLAYPPIHEAPPLAIRESPCEYHQIGKRKTPPSKSMKKYRNPSKNVDIIVLV